MTEAFEMAKKEPYGMGGWLFILVVVLTLIWPLGTAISISTQLTGAEQTYPALHQNQHWNDYKLFYTVAVVCSMILSIFTGIKLADNRTPETILLAKRTLWIIFPGLTTAVSIVFPVALIPTAPFIHLPAALLGIVGATIPAYLGTLYLSKSRRVRNTYGL